MSKVEQIESRVRYCAFKKTIKIMLTPTDIIDDLKAQLSRPDPKSEQPVLRCWLSHLSFIGDQIFSFRMPGCYK